MPPHDTATLRLAAAPDAAVSPHDPTAPNPNLPPASSPPGLHPGALATATQGRFTWRRTLGSGGMGEVWLAWDRTLGRDVAIKTLRGQHTLTAGGRSQLQWEARLLARLRHPGIVQVHELIEARGQPLLVMEYAPGRDLAAVLRDAPPSRDRLLALMADVCEAVAHAHASGVIHRDLKPGNLMLMPDGRIRVMDFGVAELGRGGWAGEDSAGTPGYMAPELLTGRPVASAASDVFAIGAILYQGLTGQRPYGSGTTVEIIGRTLRNQRTADARLARCGPDVAAVVLKALAHDPAQRHPSATALAEDLRRLRAGLPVSARRYPFLIRLGRALAWRWGTALLGTAVGLGALALVSLSAASVHAHAEQSALRSFEDAAKEVALMTGLALPAPPLAAPAESVARRLKQQNSHVRDIYLLTRDNGGWRLRFAQHGAQAQREQPRGHDTWGMREGIVTREDARLRLEAALAGGLTLEYEHDTEGQKNQEWNRRLLVYAPAAWQGDQPAAVVVLEYASGAVLDIFLDIERALELSLLAGAALAAVLILLHWAWLVRAWHSTPPG